MLQDLPLLSEKPYYDSQSINDYHRIKAGTLTYKRVRQVGFIKGSQARTTLLLEGSQSLKQAFFAEPVAHSYERG